MGILVAEDDFTLWTVLASVLKMEGHEVVALVNGAQAWEVLQNVERHALAIIHRVMTEMDGPEVICRVRGLPTTRPPYIIVLTRKGDKADIIAGLDAGANDYLSQPFDCRELHARIEVGQPVIEMPEPLIESRDILAHQAS